MFSLDFWYFFFFFFVWNKTVYEKCTKSRNVSRNISFENSVVHSNIFSYQAEAFNGNYDKLKMVIGQNGLIFVWVELCELFLSR